MVGHSIWDGHSPVEMIYEEEKKMATIEFHGLTTAEAVKVAVAAVDAVGTFVLENMQVKD